MAHYARAYLGFSIMKRLAVDLLPTGWNATPSQGFPQHYLFIHLGEDTHCEGKEVAQEHNTMFPAKAQARIACFGVERANHEATTLSKRKKLDAWTSSRFF